MKITILKKLGLAIPSFFCLFYSKILKYSPYPSFSKFSLGTNLKAAPFMQYLSPPNSCGPSGKTWPRWLSAFLLLTSVLTMPWDRSSFSFISVPSTGFEKLGQPHPALNLSLLEKSGSPDTLST